MMKITPDWQEQTERCSTWKLAGGATWSLLAINESEGGRKVFKKHPPTTGYLLQLQLPKRARLILVGKYNGTLSRHHAQGAAVRITRQVQEAIAGDLIRGAATVCKRSNDDIVGAMAATISKTDRDSTGYFDGVCSALQWLAGHDVPRIDAAMKAARDRAAKQRAV